MNFASIEVAFTDKPEVNFGKSGKAYSYPRAVLVHRDRDGNTVEADMRGLAAFGEVAERLASVDTGVTYQLTCEVGAKQGRGEYADRVFLEWVIRGVAEVVGRRARQAAAPELQQARAEPEQAASDGTDELPFGWLIGLATLGLGLGPMVA